MEASPEGQTTTEGEKPEAEKPTDPTPDGEKSEGSAEQKPAEKSVGFDELPKETQDEIKRLRSEAKERRQNEQKLTERLTELEDADKSDKEKAEAKAARAEEARVAAESKLLRYEVASEKKVPQEAIELLTAKTRDDLEAQADRIIKLAANSKKGADFDGGVRQTENDPPVSAEAQHGVDILKLLGREPEPTQ